MNLAQPGEIGKTLRAQLGRLGAGDRQAERRALAAGGNVLKAAIRAQLARAGGRRRAAGRPASEPGQPPALQTRQLYASIATQWRGRKLRVGTGLIRGRFLEYGTARMQARPFMRPAFAAAKGQMGPVAAVALRQGKGATV